MTGGRVWAEPAPVAPVPQAGADIILPPEVLAQRAAEEQQRREMEKRRNRLPGKWPGRRVKLGEPADRVKEVIGDVIRGLERDRPGTEKTTLPDDPQFRRRGRRRFNRWPQNVCSVSVCRLWSGTWCAT